jgi:hypothetical protein
MASSGMLHHLDLVRTDVVEELSANIVPSSPILVTLMMEGLSSSETSVITRATRRNILEDVVLHIQVCFQKWLNSSLSQSGHCGNEKYFLSLPGIEPKFSVHATPSITSTLAALGQ